MNSTGLNLCQSCVYLHSCVLTLQKEKVWSCSEYESNTTELSETKPPKKVSSKKRKLVVSI
ncbi:MAG: hypothetical protein DWP98_03385 [Bacteroidetes bacterium]|nr:MAG: hypothetical protein DWP98_03385 [Bacteroidota bacterium]MBL1145133.1 hypothetical protein [Bacteroidota bacterium]